MNLLGMAVILFTAHLNKIWLAVLQKQYIYIAAAKGEMFTIHEAKGSFI